MLAMASLVNVASPFTSLYLTRAGSVLAVTFFVSTFWFSIFMRGQAVFLLANLLPCDLSLTLVPSPCETVRIILLMLVLLAMSPPVTAVIAAIAAF